jgi:hypothetical protein
MTVFAALAALAVLGGLALVPVLVRITLSPGGALFTVQYGRFPLYESSLLRALRGYGPALRGSLRFLRCRRCRLRLRFSGGDAAETALLHGWLCGVLAALSPLGVCRASHVKPQKIANQAILYPSNSVVPTVRSSPIIGDFLRLQAQKIHKCDRLLACRPEIALEPSFSSRGELAVEGEIALCLPLPVLLFRILPRRIRAAAGKRA